MKISKFRKLTKQIQELSEKIWAEEPPKKYILIWCNKRLDRELRTERFYTLQEMLDFKEDIIGASNPSYYDFTLTKEITKHP